MPRLGLDELVILSTMLVVFFGSRKLPEFIRGLADSVKEFKKTAGAQE